MSSATDSSSHDPGKVLDSEELLRRFDRAWDQGSSPRIEQFLPPEKAATAPVELVRELVLIDLEYRWRKGGPAGPIPSRPLLEDYAVCYPMLGDPRQWPAEWIAEEYRAKRSWGQASSHSEFFRRFPGKQERLRQALLEVDAELVAEKSRNSAGLRRTEVSPSATDISRSVSATTVLEAVRAAELLTGQQLEEIGQAGGKTGFSAAKELLDDLVDRGWLTPYQARRLSAGRCKDLLLETYVVLDLLGEGAMGQVFKARHRRMARVAALKIIRPELLADSEVLRRFYREIEVVSQFDHPNVVHAYDAGPVGNTHMLAMEYVEGIDLARLVKKQGPLPVALACDTIRQAALGLQYAHERGLVHRDIKPSNLMIADCGLRIRKNNPQSAIRNPQS